MESGRILNILASLFRAPGDGYNPPRVNNLPRHHRIWPGIPGDVMSVFKHVIYA